MKLAAALREVAATGPSEAIREARLSSREYLSDGYRLTHRLLRTRRRDLIDAGYVHRSGEVDVEWDVMVGARERVNLLEEWRYASLIALESRDVADELLFAGRYFEIADALLAGSTNMSKVVDRQRLPKARLQHSPTIYTPAPARPRHAESSRGRRRYLEVYPPKDRHRRYQRIGRPKYFGVHIFPEPCKLDCDAPSAARVQVQGLRRHEGDFRFRDPSGPT